MLLCGLWVSLGAMAQAVEDPRWDTPLSAERQIEQAPEAAQSQIQHAMRIARHSGNTVAEGQAWLLTAKLALQQDNQVEARAAHDQARRLLQNAGTQRDLSRLALQELHLRIRASARPEVVDAAAAAAFDAASRADDRWAQSQVRMLEGYVAARRGEFALAEAHDQEFLTLARRMDDPRLQALALNNLANAQKNLGQLGAALDSHLQALALRERLGNESSIVQSLSNLVLVYQILEDWPQARRYSEQALQRSAALSDAREQLRIALNHAGLLNQTGDVADATAALALLDGLQPLPADVEPAWQRSLLSSRSAALIHLGRPEEARADALAAVALARTLKVRNELAEALQTLANAWLAQTPAALQAARQALEEAIVLAGEARTTALERKLRLALSEVLERMGALREALTERRAYEHLDRVVHGLDQVRRIAALEQQLAIGSRDRALQTLRMEQALQQDRSDRQRWLGGMALVSLLAIALALSTRIRFVRKRAQALAQENLLLERLATTDALTGLHNRQWLLRRLQGAGVTLQPDGGLALLDVDHFKQVNDRHGHASGDAVLIGLARLIEAWQPPGSTCARWGGEEFLLWLPDSASAPMHLEQLRELVAAAQLAGLAVTCSIGLAIRRPGEPISQWSARADAALYAAKQAGRNRLCVAAD